MKLPTDSPVTIRFMDGKELAVHVQEYDELGILATSAEGQARTIVIPWSAINQVTWQRAFGRLRPLAAVVAGDALELGRILATGRAAVIRERSAGVTPCAVDPGLCAHRRLLLSWTAVP